MTIAPAAVIAVLVTIAIAGLTTLDSGPETADAGNIGPVGTFCDTPSDPCFPDNLTPTPATPVGGMDAMSVDMDPSSAPANTATSIGSREFCARINENGIVDADEEEVDTLELDVTTGPLGIPASSPMIAFTFPLLYDPGTFSVIANDTDFLLNAAEGSSIFEASDTLPDSDGKFTAAAVDTGLTSVVSETDPACLPACR